MPSTSQRNDLETPTTLPRALFTYRQQKAKRKIPINAKMHRCQREKKSLDKRERNLCFH
jgi:hypothetical protein